MKKLILIAMLMLAPMLTQAQVDIVREQGSGFYIETAAGDTLQLSGSTPFYNSYHTAFEDAINWSGNNGGLEFYIRRDLTYRGSAFFYNEDIFIEEVVDTVYVPADTIYVEQDPIYMPADTVYVEADTVFVEQDPVYLPGDTITVTEIDTVYADSVMVPVYSYVQPSHHALIKDISWDMQITEDTTRYINFTIATTQTDTLYTEIRCGTEWVENNMFTPPADTLYYGIIWDCSSPLTYQMTATNIDGWEETVTNSYPLWMTTFNGPEPSYTLWWGDMTYSIYNGVITMELPNRSIARIKDESVPLHSDIQVQVTEVVDTTHSTGIHLAMRTSEAERESSVETYLNNNGMGVSIFSNGSWSNPVNFPVEWEYDVPITYTVSLVGDTITVVTGGETYTYTSDVIGNTPPGYLTMGSTGSGIYIINDIQATILD